MYSKHTIAFLLICLFTFNSCNSDIDIQAEYDDIPVVYGLLNHLDDYHYIRVSKTFIGPGDAYEMAQIQDSLEYQNVIVQLQEINASGDILRTIDFKDTILTTKQKGTFSSPNQKLYFHAPFFEGKPDLDPQYSYKLLVDIDNGRKVAISETKLIDGTLDAFSAYLSPSNDIRFFRNEQFLSTTMPLIIPNNATFGDMKMYFNYVDVYANGDVIARKLEYNLGEVRRSNNPNDNRAEVRISGERFYELIAAQIPDIDDVPGLIRRIPGNPNISNQTNRPIEFVFSAGSSELMIYREVNSPSVQGFQEKPVYTNIENGLGIFASRTVFRKYLDIDRFTARELVYGVKSGTGAKGFCHYNDANDSRYCN
jgi:hypothetical protein